MNIISCHVEINEYEHLGNKSKKSAALKQFVLPHFVELANQLAEKCKEKSVKLY